MHYVCVCMCVYHDVLIRTVKIMNGSSANTWHVCMKSANLILPITVQSEICQRRAAMTNLVCIVVFAQICAAGFLIELHLLMDHFCRKDNDFSVFPVYFYWVFSNVSSYFLLLYYFSIVCQSYVFLYVYRCYEIKFWINIYIYRYKYIYRVFFFQRRL